MKYLVMILVSFIGLNGVAQCSLACFNTVSVDMNINCEYTVSEIDLLDNPGASCPAGVFVIDITDGTGTIPSSPTIDILHVGQVLNFTITDTNTGNSCFGNITAVDVMAPSITCIADITANLNAAGEVTLVPNDLLDSVSDSCDPNPTLTVSPNIFFCNDVGIPQSAILTVIDISGNSSSCFSSVAIEDVNPPSLVCFSDLFLDMDASLSIILDPLDAVSSLTDNCSLNTTIASQTTFDCSNLGGNFVTITATDASNNTSSCFTNVEISDPSSFCIPPSLIITGTLNSDQTYQATNFIQFDATVIPGVSIILQAPSVFTVNGCEVQLGGALEINP